MRGHLTGPRAGAADGRPPRRLGWSALCAWKTTVVVVVVTIVVVIVAAVLGALGSAVIYCSHGYITANPGQLRTAKAAQSVLDA
uniref:Uncharacterized protein n=1 Tax=Plectus sambesii TaxID=2011161 RepID=A0A914V8I8_9BILA